MAKGQRLLNPPPNQSNYVASQQLALLRLLLVSKTCEKVLGQYHFAEPNWHVLTFVHPKFAVPCTSGVARTG